MINAARTAFLVNTNSAMRINAARTAVLVNTAAKVSSEKVEM